MKHVASLIVLVVFSIGSWAQTGQLGIDRISQMPDLPTPYLMRDWKQVALDYDQLIFSSQDTGEFLPLLTLKSQGINYPELSPILLQSYVGSNGSNVAEAINIIPAMVGASLVGVDKTTQEGINWALKTKDFFNKNNGQNVYLNGYSEKSGGDWWYDVMPNIFFYQLYSQYPGLSDYNEQFISVSDQWLAAIYAMGGSNTPWNIPNMDYRAWNLEDMTGNAEGVHEPEASGGIGWILYHAYLETGDSKYLEGAQLSMEFLNNYPSNPSYELQLPYGAFIAARMNAEQGTSYDIEKILNWCFDRGPIRGWGAISGTWNGSDVDGLIGEANDSGNDYAFTMNGFQQAAALMPLVKYDKRFAHDIAKWILNLANASRFFYSAYLPEQSQDDYLWSTSHDPNSALAYEALKELWEGKPLYATGDAKRSGWAETNLALYGSSHVGYLGGILQTTDVEGILLLDANKTDFFQKEDYPTYVVYNPHSQIEQVSIPLPAGNHDIYDAIHETVIATGVSSEVTLTIIADEVLLLVCIPSGSTPEAQNGKLFVNTTIIDHHYGYDFSGKLRIKSLAVTDTLVEFNQQVSVYTEVENAQDIVTYNWSVNGTFHSSSIEGNFNWQVPENSGQTVLTLDIESNGELDQDSIVFNVVETIPQAPVIQTIDGDQSWYLTNTEAILHCEASDDDQTAEELTYEWIVTDGLILSQDGSNLTWQTPVEEGLYVITCRVSDQSGLSVEGTKHVLVKEIVQGSTAAYAYYPMDGNTLDYSGNDRHADNFGVDLTQDARGEADHAYLFNVGSDLIVVPNTASLNFKNAITLSFWLKLNNVTEEAFLLSHGSWEERWKVSITPGKQLRWTVKTLEGTLDLDSTFPLTLNQFYHCTAVYTGYSMELYIDGILESYLLQNGEMGTTSNSLTFGRKDAGEEQYFLRGVLDEVRIYDLALDPDEIFTLKSRWNTVTGLEEKPMTFQLFPNPNNGNFSIDGSEGLVSMGISIYDLSGRKIPFYSDYIEGQFQIRIRDMASGVMVMKLESKGSVYFRKLIVDLK